MVSNVSRVMGTRHGIIASYLGWGVLTVLMIAEEYQQTSVGQVAGGVISDSKGWCAT